MIDNARQERYAFDKDGNADAMSDVRDSHRADSHIMTVDVNLSAVMRNGDTSNEHRYASDLRSISIHNDDTDQSDGMQHLIDALNSVDDAFDYDMPDIDTELDADAFPEDTLDDDMMSIADVFDKGRFVYEIELIRHGSVNGASDRNDYILMETPPSDAVTDDEQIISPIVISAVDSPYDDIRVSDALGDNVLAYLTEEACEYDMAFHPDTATVTVQMSCVLSDKLADSIDTSDGFAWYRIIPIRQNGHVSDVVILNPNGEYAYAFGASTNMKLARAYDIAIRSEANASETDGLMD